MKGRVTCQLVCSHYCSMPLGRRGCKAEKREEHNSTERERAQNGVLFWNVWHCHIYIRLDYLYSPFEAIVVY